MKGKDYIKCMPHVHLIRARAKIRMHLDIGLKIADSYIWH